MVAIGERIRLTQTGWEHPLEHEIDGAPLPALGEGTVCDFCAARGLCRKDMWS